MTRIERDGSGLLVKRIRGATISTRLGWAPWMGEDIKTLARWDRRSISGKYCDLEAHKGRMRRLRKGRTQAKARRELRRLLDQLGATRHGCLVVPVSAAASARILSATTHLPARAMRA